MDSAASSGRRSKYLSSNAPYWSILADVSGQPDHSRHLVQPYAVLRRGNRAASCRYNPSVGVRGEIADPGVRHRPEKFSMV
jgi:hypothetical protein